MSIANTDCVLTVADLCDGSGECSCEMCESESEAWVWWQDFAGRATKGQAAWETIEEALSRHRRRRERIEEERAAGGLSDFELDDLAAEEALLDEAEAQTREHGEVMELWKRMDRVLAPIGCKTLQCAYPDDVPALREYVERIERELPLYRYVLPVTGEPREREPAILETDDGRTILYANRTNILHGLPGTAKTWIAILAVIQAMEQGIPVLWWDFEDKPATFAARARTLGALEAFQDPERFSYVVPSIVEDSEAMQQAAAWVDGGLTVIDAAESAGCPSDGTPINEWWERHVTPWREAGAGVLILDHEPKRQEGRPRGPIGSVHKLSRVDGCALRLSGTAWTKRTDGTIYLVVHKDRPGDLPAVGQVVAVATGSWDSNGALQLDLRSPSKQDEQEDGDELQDELLRVIAVKGDEGVTGWRTLRGLVKASNRAVEDAISQLVETGLVTQQSVGRGIRWVAVEGVQDVLELTEDPTDE